LVEPWVISRNRQLYDFHIARDGTDQPFPDTPDTSRKLVSADGHIGAKKIIFL
jgi:hypothetical protein